MQKKSILVIFGKELPKKNKSWFEKFDKVLTGKELEEFINPGSVQEACLLVDELSRLTFSDERRLSKIINYQGYELWWVHYDDLMEKFCLPYTQYRKLLEHLKDFEEIYLYQAPYSGLFRYFLNAHGRQCVILNELKKTFPPLGILVQVMLSLMFLPWLKITRPKLMVWAGDRFDPPHDYDFRMRFIYKELRNSKVAFVEFIRSQEHLMTVLNHIFKRKRPVIYSGAIISFLHSFAKFFSKKEERELLKLHISKEISPEKLFWFFVAAHYLSNFKGTIWSIKAMKFILQLSGVKSAVVLTGCSRTFHEILGCKLAGIKTVGIQHAALPRYFFVADFMPGFDGKNALSTDKFGLWSNWWRDYYLAHGRAFRAEQLYISGSLRPLEKETIRRGAAAEGRLRVLFISEQLADPAEVMPYLLAVLSAEDFDVFLKFRLQRDGFEEWLKNNEPRILERVKITKGDIHQAVADSDVAVGSHSTAVLEALAQQKPIVFFRTKKWGDYFDMKSFDAQDYFFAENPEELIGCIRKSINVPKEVLKQMQERFFGDPHQNGSKWMVEQAIKFLNQYEKQ